MAKYKRRAEWIWRQRELLGLDNRMPRHERRAHRLALAADETNRFLYFRKTFVLDDDVTTASVDVSADGRYQLFVNGHFIGRGPARSSSDARSYDTYDLAPYLAPGKNVIAALVRSYGRDCSWYELPRWGHGAVFGCGGFFVQGSARTISGSDISLDTNDSWRYLVSQAWERDTLTGRLGYAEEYDARRAPADWKGVDHDDTSWSTAQILRMPGEIVGTDAIPFPIMVPRSIPMMQEKVHWPASIVTFGEVADAPRQKSIAQQMHSEELRPLSACRAEKMEDMLVPDGVAEIICPKGRSVSIVLDFGQTETGRIRINAHGPSGTIIDFCYGDKIQEDGRITPTGWGPFHIYAHRVVCADEPLSWEMFDRGGFRYVQITFRGCTEPLHVEGVSVNYSSYPVGNRGQFECSDALLNKAYTISAWTLQCCMHDAYEDCPTREQRQWINDQYIHQLCNFAMFGDPHLARSCLLQCARAQQGDGILLPAAPGDLAVSDVLNFTGMTLYYLMSIPQYVRYTGDVDILRQLYPTIVKALAWFERHMDEDDLLCDVPGAVWIDWSDVGRKGQVTELNARFAACLKSASAIAACLGYDYDEKRYAELAERVSSGLRRHLWDVDRQVYVDCRQDGVPSRRVSQESSTAVMYHGIAPKIQWAPVLAYITDERRLVHTPMAVDHLGYQNKAGFDEETEVVLQQAFYMHFLHAVWAKLGKGQEILENIRRHWGPQIEAGTSTWWEGWQQGPHPSLCHAFSCTPGFDLASYILGVTPITDGFQRFRIAPLMGDLAWARGVYPSIKGDVPVSWEWNDNQLEISFTVPEDTEAEIELPIVENLQLETIEMDGQKSSPGRLVASAGHHRIVAYYCPGAD